MDSDAGMENAGEQARNAASALSTVKRNMQELATMTSEDSRLLNVLKKLGDQRTAFNGSLRKSTTMFKSSAETAKQVEELLKTIDNDHVDDAGVRKIAEGIQREASETARKIQEINEGLRTINSNLNNISRDVTQLAASLEADKQQTQTFYNNADARLEEANDDAASAHRRKSSMLKGLAVGTVILLCIFWPAIPFWCCYTGCGAFLADRQEKGHNETVDEMKLELWSLTKEIKLLGESEDKSTVIQGAIPDIIKGFEGMYNFYGKIDTDMKGITRGDPKAQKRLMNKKNVRDWRDLHRQLGKHHAELEAAQDDKE
jgi:uncharacterized phage infection (PIP) family protein YhgE